MKKSTLLQPDMSYLAATLGHTDEVTICDAGLPVPEGVERIDLALTYGVPSFIQTVDVWLKETQIEGVVIAEEFKSVSPELHQALMARIEEEQQSSGKEITVSYVSHETFKQRTNNSKAVIRTGECTPYANVIFSSGVVF